MSNLQVFDELKAEITIFVKPVLSVTVDSGAKKDEALVAAQQIKRLQNAVEKRRKELVDPLNAQVKQINAYAKEILSPLDGAESHLRKNLIHWEQHLEVERRKAQDKLDAERRAREEAERAESLKAKQVTAEAEDLFGETSEYDKEQIKAEEDRKKFLAQQEIDSKQKAIADSRVKGTRKVWTFELVDETKIPREFLSVDERKIRAAIAAGSRQIDGVKIFEDIKISIRS